MAEVEAVQIIAESLKQQVRGSPGRPVICPTFWHCTFLHLGYCPTTIYLICERGPRNLWRWQEQWSGLLS